MLHRTALLLSVFFSLLPTSAVLAAQPADSIRAHVGGDLLLAIPVGAFAENVDLGGGLGGYAHFAIDEKGILGVRLDLGFLNYGNETIRICVTQPCRVTGNLTTSNNIFFGGIGPEIGIGSAGIRAYANAGIGFAYFSTSSSVEGSGNQGDPFASSTNFQDGTFAWTAGGGFQFRLSSGRTPFFLNLGARYHGNGEVQYLRKGDIQDLPDGSVSINPRRGPADLWTIQLGIRTVILPDR